MLKTILGIKRSQTQLFTETGKRIPVTVIEAGPCYVTGHTTGDATSIQLGFVETKNIAKAQTGHLKKAGVDKKLRFFRSVRMDEIPETLTVGSVVAVGDVLSAKDTIRVTGISKGKGFAGVVKRHNFKGGPRTHGQSDRERHGGSIGMTTTPGRVFKGKRMAGRMGNDRITVRGLKVFSIDATKNLITIKGVVPGAINSLVILEKEKDGSGKVV